MNSPSQADYAMLEHRLEAALAELADERAYQAATHEVLQVINASEGDLQPVFDAITEHAMRLCGAHIGSFGTFDGELIHMQSYRGVEPDAEAAMRAVFPMKPGQGFAMARAVAEKAPVQIHDVLADPAYAGKESAVQAKLHAGLAVPLLRDGEVIGSIGVARSAIGSFSTGQVTLLQTFADQAVLAIENARLFNEAQEALERQTATAEVLDVISRSPTDVQPVFDAIAERAMALCDGQWASTTRFDGEWIHLTAIAGIDAGNEPWDGLRDAFPMKPGAGTMHARAIKQGVPAQTADYREDRDFDPSAKEAMRHSGIRSVLSVPMLHDDKVIGSIGVSRSVPGAFPDKLVSLLQTFAAQAAIAIENVRLFREIEEALEQQTASSEVLRVISESPTDVQPVFDAIAERAMALCGADVGVATRYDGEWIHLSDVFGVDRDTVETIRASFPVKPGRDTLSGRVVSERKPVQIPDTAADTEFSVQAAAEVAGSIFGVPLMREGIVVGTLMIARRRTGAFPDKLVKLLQTFADQAVIAIENVRLFNETKEALDQQTAISDILRITTESPSDVQPVLEVLADHAAHLCEAASASIFLTEGDSLRHVVSRGARAEEVFETDLIPIDRTSTSGRAILDRKTVHVEDMQSEAAEYPRGFEIAQRLGHRTIAVAPLLREGRPFGTILLRRLEVRPFDARELRLLRTFGDQAAIALENVRLFNETKEALDRQTATAEVLRVIGSSVEDAAPVFEAIVDSCRNLFNSEEIMILLERDDGQVVVGAHSNQTTINTNPKGTAKKRPTSALFPLARSDSIHGMAVEARKTLYFPNVAELSDRPIDMEAVFASSGDHSLIAAPMIRDGRGIGTLLVGQFPPRPFTEKEIALLTTFADQAVIAIENARLFKETQDALEQQTATAEVLQVISNSIEDTAPVFEKILDSCERLFKGESLAVLLVGDDGLAHVGALRGPLVQDARNTFPLPIDQTGMPEALNRGTLVHYPDFSAVANKPFPLRLIYERVGNFSSAIAPMLLDGRAIGTISVNRFPPRPFSDKEISVLTTFADQAVIAIANARLFNETREALEQQTATAGILRVISSSVSDTAPVFEKILESCERLFDTEQIAMFLVDGETVNLGAFRGEMADVISDAYPQPLETSLTGLAIRERRALHYPNVANVADKPRDMADVYERVGNHAVLAAPMLWENKGIGTILVARVPPRAFSDKDIAVLTTFADQAVIAIENARLFHEIEDKSHELGVANQHKSEFLANMSHELRTPLNAIIGFSEVLNERMFGELNEKQADYLNDIYNSGKHLLALINDILDLSKIEAGRMELELESFDVEDALSNTLTLIRERAQQHAIELAFEPNDELGLFRADQRKLKQIMLNLLSNAVKFTPDGGSIRIDARIDKGALEVSVTDTGIGIAPEDQQAIFQEFRQAGGNYTNKREGTGLGLALTKRFVELHGGTLSLDSEPRRGSTFTFTLPGQA
ncbi:MAG: GAF domain-containing protein [Gammaproteobacteria bacterium]